MTKKIAFIGCSHLSCLDVPGQEYNNWTYLLHNKYPQHTYRNYSRGGQGIEGFQWALLDAKKWGADVVFLNRTYAGRWSMLTEIANISKFEYHERTWTDKEDLTSDNWCESGPSFELIWGTANDAKVQHSSSTTDDKAISHYMLDPIMNKLSKNMDFWIGQTAASDLRKSWEQEWYDNVEALYNFDNIFLIDWADTHDHVSSTTWDTPVIEWFAERYNFPSPTDQSLNLHGLAVSAEDTHLSLKGNTELLNDYILANNKVVNSLK